MKNKKITFDTWTKIYGLPISAPHSQSAWHSRQYCEAGSFNLSRGFLNIEVNENIDLLAWHHETNNILFLFLNVSAEARVGQ